MLIGQDQKPLPAPTWAISGCKDDMRFTCSALVLVSSGFFQKRRMSEGVVPSLPGAGDGSIRNIFDPAPVSDELLLSRRQPRLERQSSQLLSRGERYSFKPLPPARSKLKQQVGRKRLFHLLSLRWNRTSCCCCCRPGSAHQEAKSTANGDSCSYFNGVSAQIPDEGMSVSVTTEPSAVEEDRDQTPPPAELVANEDSMVVSEDDPDANVADDTREEHDVISEFLFCPEDIHFFR